jgi:pimeloyl-ACP methyl ester carboxylesterase
MDHGLFAHQMEYFSQNYQVISWDVPQHGRSRPYEGFSLQVAATELISILDAEGVDKAHLVGQSMGGYISQIVALDDPERVRSLTAVASSPLQASYYSAVDRWLLSITPSLLRLYPYNYLIKIIATQIACQEPAQSYALETLKGLTKTEIADIMKEVYQGLKPYQHDFQLSLPILIVYGDADRTGKVRSYCNQWAKREERPLKIIPQAAHNANMDNPVDFNQALSEFLEEMIQ